MTITNENDTPATDHTDHTGTLPEGTYRARAREWDWDTTKSGDMCLAVMFELIDGRPGYQLDGRLYFDEAKPDAKGRTALSRSMEVLAAMGLQGDDLSVIDANAGGLNGGEVNLVTFINEKGYPAIKFINTPRQQRDLRTFAPPAQNEKMAFFARMKARTESLTAKSAASGTAPLKPRATAPTQQNARSVQQPAKTTGPGFGASDFPSDDSDIPF